MSLFSLFSPNTSYPAFWEAYVNSFDKETSDYVDDTRFVAIDCETTGLHKQKDRMLSLGAIAIEDKKIQVHEAMETFVAQKYFRKDTVAIHGIRKSGRSKMSELEALESFLDFISNAVLIGHHITFDLAMINQALKRHGLKKLKNQTIDTGRFYRDHIQPGFEAERHISLDELCKILKIRMKDRHTALGDAYLSGLAFIKMLGKSKLEPPIKLKQIL
ncbi:3'-5' exonuclease [Croceiramulus getboli]|nr:exonuclease domain-containing protein [Flavobacteriaceae bacterium YJPT1-3]